MRRWVGRSVFFGVVLMLAACGTQRPAPVVDRSGPTNVRPDAAAGASVPPAQRVAKEGIYTVQRGDTLYSIATSFGVDVRELARWNNLGDSVSLSVGQALRVTAPPASAATVTPVAPVGSAEVRPLPGAEASPSGRDSARPYVATGRTDHARDAIDTVSASAARGAGRSNRAAGDRQAGTD